MDKVAAYHFIMSQDPLWEDLAYELEKSAASFSADDIRRKMESAQRLANDPSASPSERETAAKMAANLRAKLSSMGASETGNTGWKRTGTAGRTRNPFKFNLPNKYLVGGAIATLLGTEISHRRRQTKLRIEEAARKLRNRRIAIGGAAGAAGAALLGAGGYGYHKYKNSQN
jgi:hypothetical protein